MTARNVHEDAISCKIVLAYNPLENPTTNANSAIGNALSEILFAELGKTGRFQLVDRSVFETIAKDIDFGTSGWVKKDSVAGKKWMAGADYVLIGKVTDFSFHETQVVWKVQTGRGMAQQKVYKQDATVRVDFRIVCTTTGVSIVTESSSDSRTNYGATSEMAAFTRLQQTGFRYAGVQDSLIGRTTVGACQKVVRKIRDSHQELKYLPLCQRYSLATV